MTPERLVEIEKLNNRGYYDDRDGAAPPIIEELIEAIRELQPNDERWRTVLERMQTTILPPFWRIRVNLVADYPTVEEAFTAAIDAVRAAKEKEKSE